MATHSGTLLDLGLTTEHLPAGENRRVLVCGDADFAYSRALAAQLRGTGTLIWTSCYEPEADLLVRYPHAAAAIEALKQEDANVSCGVDARFLASHFGKGAFFDRIVFNLPQSPPLPGARNQIQRHRALLRDFCKSAEGQLTPDGQLWITLLAGQGGTQVDTIQRPPGDTWQLQLEAARAGLLVNSVLHADPDELLAVGYAPTGRRQNKKLGAGRQSRGLLVHIIEREGLRTTTAVGALEWAFDNSFWVKDDSAPSPFTLFAQIQHALGASMAHSIAGVPELLDEYKRPEDGRRARTYRFTYRSSVVALSRERALQANESVCVAIAKANSAQTRSLPEKALRATLLEKAPPEEAEALKVQEQAQALPEIQSSFTSERPQEGGEKAAVTAIVEPGRMPSSRLDDKHRQQQRDATLGPEQGGAHTYEVSVDDLVEQLGSSAVFTKAACGGRWKQP